jgi:hypothetical protein
MVVLISHLMSSEQKETISVKYKLNSCKQGIKKLKEIHFMITSNKINLISITEIEGVTHNGTFLS